jgi:hypothetical protein
VKATEGRVRSLKGALVFRIWEGPAARPTRDVDLLGPPSLDADDLRRMIIDCTGDGIAEDGIEFETESIAIASIRAITENVGLRATFDGLLGRSKLRYQLDVGVGDGVFPAPVLSEYPTLLGDPAPRLLVYTRYTVVAEKLEAMVTLGDANSRLKDYFDIAHLAATEEFEGSILQGAIREAFRARAVVVPIETPPALEDRFAGLAGKQTQWRAFIQRRRLVRPTLDDAIRGSREFLMPVCRAEATDQRFTARWIPEGPWRD